ncbi:MAG: hypothetical protein II630_01690 [Bacteroidales bacterium]|nr:hypothetical protein [Bacteroidales bacterium]
MKQLVQTQLPVLLEGITDYWDSLDHIEVVFSQYVSGTPIKTEIWKSDGTGDVTRDGDVIYIPWTRAETSEFAEGKPFFMDIRPTLVSGDDLEVNIVKLTMNNTLFEET